VGSESSGDFYFSPDGRLIRRDERGVAPFVYAGVGIIKPQLFNSDRRTIFKLAPYFFDAAEKGRLFGQRLDGKWLHVGTQDAIKEAQDCLIKSFI
jgi:MurNAc alpha-1-phosphate uridylyltransferase